MATKTIFPVPEGYYEPFAVVTEGDHSGWLIIATALGLAMVLLSSVIRVTIRIMFGQKFGIDDVILGAATVRLILKQRISGIELILTL
jgi:hypothetical protein